MSKSEGTAEARNILIFYVWVRASENIEQIVDVTVWMTGYWACLQKVYVTKKIIWG